MNSQVEESLSAIRVVKSFVMEQAEALKFRRHNERFLKSREGTYRSEALFYNGLEWCTGILVVLVIVIGAARITSGSIDLADLLTFILYLNFLVEPVRNMGFMTMQYQEGMSGFKRFQEALAWTPERRGGEPVALQGAVTFDHVAFQYETGRPVLRDVHVDVRPGEYVAIVGASGVGKTTLASLLSAFYHPGAGELKYDGVSQHVLDLHVLRRQIAVVQQDVHLFSGTILDNIRYGSEAGQEEIEAAARLANADEFIRAFRKGYATEVGPRGVKLSGGQKQRISIARAFLKNPAILVLDEATSALDQQSERAVQAALETLTTGRTTFVIAHRLSTIQAAGRILVMKDGRIVEEGPHGELMKRAGAYADLYRSVAIV